MIKNPAPAVPAAAPDAFHAAMHAANVLALWERHARDPEPESSQLWRWQTMAPLLDAAVAQTSMTEAERRVLILANPAYTRLGTYGACGTMAVNLQILMPGERARPHRHTMHALRFVLEGDDVTTIVEGKHCKMEPGDLILTPAWTWHEHRHEGRARSVWVDALDVPFHDFLGNRKFEPGPAHDVSILQPDAAFSAPGIGPELAPAAYSPMFRYAWTDASRALEAIHPAADGARVLHYTNPLTGGPILSTLDCHLIAPGAGRDTQAYRTNSNAVCVVAQGSGATRIGDQTIEWAKHDIFSLPNGNWISHRAASSDAILFRISDREILRRLDFLREETRAE